MAVLTERTDSPQEIACNMQEDIAACSKTRRQNRKREKNLRKVPLYIALPPIRQDFKAGARGGGWDWAEAWRLPVAGWHNVFGGEAINRVGTNVQAWNKFFGAAMPGLTFA